MEPLGSCAVVALEPVVTYAVVNVLVVLAVLVVPTSRVRAIPMQL
jgi:hypothetical protein